MEALIVASLIAIYSIAYDGHITLIWVVVALSATPHLHYIFRSQSAPTHRGMHRANEVHLNNNNNNNNTPVAIVFILLVRLAVVGGFCFSPITRCSGEISQHNHRHCVGPPRFKYDIRRRPGCSALGGTMRWLHYQPAGSKTQGMMSFGQNENGGNGIIADGRDCSHSWCENKPVGTDNSESYCCKPELQIGHHGDIGCGSIHVRNAFGDRM